MPIVCLELSPVEERAEHHRSRSTIIKPALPKSASATALSLLIPPPGIHTISTYTSPPFLALMLLVANLANTIWCKKNGKWLKPWHMGTGKRVNSCTSRQNVWQCLVVQTFMANISKNKPNTSMTRIACKSVASLSMHQCPENCVAIGHAAIYYAWAAHAFSAWSKCLHCTHLKMLSKSFPMNTNMTGFWWFSKIFVSLCFWWK